LHGVHRSYYLAILWTKKHRPEASAKKEKSFLEACQ
jgi:hypothetical protein